MDVTILNLPKNMLIKILLSKNKIINATILLAELILKASLYQFYIYLQDVQSKNLNITYK